MAATEIAFFSAEQACRLARITLTQLRSWDRNGLFPAPRFDQKVGAFSRIYSFRDVVGLRTLGMLRNKHHVPMSELHAFDDWYRDRYTSPWSTLVFGIAGKQLCFREPGTRKMLAVTGPTGQIVHEKLIKLAPIASNVRRAFKDMKRRRVREYGKLTRKQYLVGNRWVVEGTRIPTALIWEYRQAGCTPEQILEYFPTLTRADVTAALEHEQHHQHERRAS